MTTRPDPDVLLRAFLVEGISELPDRVIDAVVADIHVTRQRARWGSRRVPLMSRFAIGTAAAAIAVLVVASAWLGLFSRPGGVGAPSPSAPVAVASSPPSSDPGASAAAPSAPGSAAPADLAIGSPFPTLQDTIKGAGIYHSVGFSAPLAFTMPKYSANPVTTVDPTGLYNAKTWPDGHTLQVFWGAGDYAVTIQDDVRLNTDLCKPDANVIDLPATPDAIGQWLHGTAGLTVTDRPDLVTSAGPAKVWDVEFGETCRDGGAAGPGNAAMWFGANEGHRMYAVPTGDDTILVVTFSSGLANKMNAETDALVSSLRFH